MLKNSLTIGLIFASFLLISCNRATSKAAETQITVEIAKPFAPVPQKTITQQSGGKVDFKGVSFSYNPQIFGEVKMEEVAELPSGGEDYKPDSVAPRHLLFKLKSSNFNRETEIFIFPIKDFRRMFAVSKQLTKAFDEELKGLQKVIKDKNFRLKGPTSFKGQIPFIPFWDGSQTFLSKVKHFPFQNGKGIFFLTQIDFETSLINNERLTYYFEGITDDKKYYILAQFAVNVSFLPKGDAEEFEDYKIPETGVIGTDKEFKQYDNYVSNVAKRLENLPANKYEPNLNHFEEIISSLKIEK